MRCKNCDRLEQRIIQLEKLVAELQKRLERYENSNKPPSAGGSYPKREPSGLKPGAQPGHEGTTREEKEPDEVRDAAPLTECPTCQHALGEPFKVLSNRFEDTPAPQKSKTTQLNQGVYECPGCGEIHIATDPQFPQSGLFGFNLMVEVVMMKFDQRLPFRKIRQALRNQFQLDLTPAAIWMLIRRVAAAGEAEFRKILKEMHKQAVVHADETSRKVKGKMRWLWVFLSSAAVLFLANRGRGKEVVEEVLGKDFNGLLGCDGWSAYSFIRLLQRCWAHLLRESKNLKQRAGGAAAAWIHKRLKKLFDTAESLRLATLSDAARQKAHDKLNRALMRVVQLAKKHKETRKFGEKIGNGMGNWFTAVLHPEIELTNNCAERAIREPVVQRKISGSLRSEDGAHALEVLMTLMSTSKLRGENPREMFLQLLRGS